MATTPELAAAVDDYLQAPGEQAEERLNQLCGTIYPVALRAVRSKLAPGSDDVHDVVQLVVVRLAIELRRIREKGELPPGNPVGWVVAVAVNACHDHFRTANRPRTQLANSVRYILRHSSTFKVWAHADRTVCGWHRCTGTPPLSPGRLIDLMRQPRVIERARELRVTDVRTVRRILARIFALAHGSVEYKPLVPAIVEASGLPGSLVVDGTAVPEPAVAATADEQAIQRPLLQFFWAETLQLPREQRLALLLHLEGREGIHALWERGAVSRTQVARALSLTEEQLGGLPWSNLQIADYIESGVAPPVTRATTVGNRDPKRDQRINKWRHDARRALENRIRAYLAGTGLDNRRASSTSYVLRPFLNRSAS